MMSTPLAIEAIPTQTWLKKHRQSHFAPAFFFLSRERREALQILYAVCRLLDDAVDVEKKSPETYLSIWRSVFENKDASPLREFGQAGLGEKFLEMAEQFQLPLYAMTELIDKGMSVDLKGNRFQTAMDVEAYCYGVAGRGGGARSSLFWG